MILKLQRELSNVDGPVLAYDQNRQIYAFVPITPELRRLFSDRARLFCDGTVRKDGTLEVNRIVPDRGW